MRLKKQNSTRRPPPAFGECPLLLSELNYEVVYTKGSAHRDVDCLSRAPVNDAEPYAEKLIFLVLPLSKSSWLKAYEHDDEAELFRLKVEVKEDKFVLHDDVIYRGTKLHVPKAKRLELIKASHDTVLTNHDGIEATLFCVEDLLWPKIYT